MLFSPQEMKLLVTLGSKMATYYILSNNLHSLGDILGGGIFGQITKPSVLFTKCQILKFVDLIYALNFG